MGQSQDARSDEKTRDMHLESQEDVSQRKDAVKEEGRIATYYKRLDTRSLTTRMGSFSSCQDISCSLIVETGLYGHQGSDVHTVGWASYTSVCTISMLHVRMRLNFCSILVSHLLGRGKKVLSSVF
jgi:hypothetical protein